MDDGSLLPAAVERSDRSPAASHDIQRFLARWRPPARTTWILLAILGAFGVEFLGGLGATSLLVLPAAAAVADLAFQTVRFPTRRVPDGAIATGLFLALLAPPSVPLVGAVTVCFAAIGLKHVVRYRGRPLMNPAASGLLIGLALFGMAPAWWAGVGPWGTTMLGAFGLALILRNPATWRIPVVFFAVYGPVLVFLKFLVGAALAPKLLLLGVLDPATLFFGLFLVPEPRTAPRNPFAHPLYAALIAVGAVGLPLVLPSPGTLVALVAANLGTAGTRMALSWRDRRVASTDRTVGRLPSGKRRRRALPAEPRPGSARRDWSIGRRIAAGVGIAILVGAIAGITYAPTSTPSVATSAPPHLPGSGGGGSPPNGAGTGTHVAVSCVADNASIPSGTLRALHRALGPSVILSYDPSSGSTLFYDPSNQVTVSETDLYEDYGYAEFNGDDFAVNGCVP